MLLLSVYIIDNYFKVKLLDFVILEMLITICQSLKELLVKELLLKRKV